MTKQTTVHLAGVVLLGIFYEPVKAATGGGMWFVLTAVGYLALLRLVGYGIARRWPHETKDQDD